MKNITVSLDDELYRRARVAAAQSDRSVTALVREFLTAFTASSAGTGTPSDAILSIVEKMRSRHPGFTAENRLSRDEIHAR
ncbi:MAG: hypothetical protein KDM91_12640 [Verrucomicrobiae bacterium]|nr:hypothetical protein [Verrucomicrobiae bacterium]MCP5538623.1 hypothetical protein [Akkermansiaceae bacterium]MCP5550914.1 hypothetical protein [Akkermansiaceae bacterium]